MRYLSTRGGEPVRAAEAIVRGISPSGGLYVPEAYPEVNVETGERGSYQATALRIMQAYFPEAEESALEGMISAAYASFDAKEVTPLVQLTSAESVLELWHGPTMAFKDVALQMLPHLMLESLRQTGEQKRVYILVATSGDTGKAALEGFKDVPGTRVLVFYPHGGVSEAQRLQMVTQEGGNMDVCAVRGNFDDAQTAVKQIFASKEIAAELEKLGWRLSSANSINFGRLLPQIVYYYTSYQTLLERGTIQPGERVNFCVPTGNFGDIFAGYVALKMGLPIDRLVLASNENDILSRYFNTGVYSQGTVAPTLSPSMDIQVASNFERYLYYLAGEDAEKLSRWMAAFKETGTLTPDVAPQACFSAARGDTEMTLVTIRAFWDAYGYLLDPHTAVGVAVGLRFLQEDAPMICLATAHPAKFGDAILRATGQDVAHHPLLDALADLPTRVRVVPARKAAVAEIVKAAVEG